MIGNYFSGLSYECKASALACLLLTFMSVLSGNGRMMAQTNRYMCGFEDENENSQWVMNSGVNGVSARNRWYVSTREHYEGVKALLISDLSVAPDTSAVYSNSKVHIVAYRDILLPAGTYDFSFAWKALGDGSADGLYVGWVDTRTGMGTSVSTIPAWTSTAAPFSGRIFNMYSGWKIETATLTSTGSPMRLAFLWTNDDKNSYSPSVCIDDIQIVEQVCGKPENIQVQVDGEEVTVNWTPATGVSTYEIKYKSIMDGKTGGQKGIRGSSYTFKGMEKGVYEFYVRSVCQNGEEGFWCARQGVIVNPDICVDYTNINSPDVLCQSGSTDNPYMNNGVVDFGSGDSRSRHTVHSAMGEVDGRTGGRLKTIPDGGMASVRLGNWETGANAESITYELHLDSGSNVVLLMQYAVVLQVPTQHGIYDQPRFTLEILAPDGELMDKTCGSYMFYASLELMEEGWHECEDPLSGVTTVYKDWSDIGVNLQEYAASGAATVKVRLTTYDCALGEHYGYAYFTLSCTEGEIKGLSCGDKPTEKITAPDGFRYRWYKMYDPTKEMVSDSITLMVEKDDTATYACDCISMEKDECYFTLWASLLPRFPKAEFEIDWTPSNCVNGFRVRNLSYVWTENGRSNEQIEEFEWVCNGDTTHEQTLTLPVPDEGGTYDISLKALISGGLCFDVKDTTVIIPAIGTAYDTIEFRTCEGGQPLIIGNKVYDEAGYYPMPSVKSKQTGCDSIDVFHVVIEESLDTSYADTICAGDTVWIGTSPYYFSGEFSKRLVSVRGCDSVVNLSLTVLPKVDFGVEVKNAVAGPRSGKIELTGMGEGWWYEIDGVLNGNIDSLDAGVYTIVVYNAYGCASEPMDVEVSAECLDLTVGDAGEICADDSAFYLPFEVASGEVTFYSVDFDDAANNAGFNDSVHMQPLDGYICVDLPEKVRPGHYVMMIEFEDLTCEPKAFEIPFDVLYSKDIMKQKWNNVVAVLNSKYNGGYEFSDFAWYRNGEKMEGEDGSYIYLGERVSFDNVEEIRVELTRTDDGIRLMSCPLMTKTRADVFPYPMCTTMGVKERVPIKDITSGVWVRLWSVGGVYFGEQYVNEDMPFFVAPDCTGVFILLIEDGTYNSRFKIVVK